MRAGWDGGMGHFHPVAHGTTLAQCALAPPALLAAGPWARPQHPGMVWAGQGDAAAQGIGPTCPHPPAPARHQTGSRQWYPPCTPAGLAGAGRGPGGGGGRAGLLRRLCRTVVSSSPDRWQPAQPDCADQSLQAASTEWANKAGCGAGFAAMYGERSNVQLIYNDVGANGEDVVGALPAGMGAAQQRPRQWGDAPAALRRLLAGRTVQPCLDVRPREQRFSCTSVRLLRW